MDNRIDKIIEDKGINPNVVHELAGAQVKFVVAVRESISNKITDLETSINNAVGKFIDPENKNKSSFFIRRAEILSCLVEGKEYPAWFIDEEVDRIKKSLEEEK
jgi:hypothetical protein